MIVNNFNYFAVENSRALSLSLSLSLVTLSKFIFVFDWSDDTLVIPTSPRYSSFDTPAEQDGRKENTTYLNLSKENYDPMEMN